MKRDDILKKPLINIKQLKITWWWH